MNKLFLLTVFFIGESIGFAGDPALPGHHALTSSQAGSLLIAELRCGACHSDVQRGSVPEKTAPDLADVGGRITPEYLRRFLANPLSTHPGTTMPDVMGRRSEDERRVVAEALTHFLVAQSKTVFQSDPVAEVDHRQGKALFHTIGCVACHGPKEPPAEAQQQPNREDEEDDDTALVARKAIKPIAVPLMHVSAKYGLRSLSEFLFQPLQVRSSGRMPDLKLTPSESLAIAGYLVGEQAQIARLVPDTALAEQGKRHFQELNCAACHAMPGIAAAPLISPKTTVNTAGGCLAPTNERSPRFDLDEKQRAAILAALQEGMSGESDKLAIAKSMTAFRCVACHVRDEYGGVHDAYNPYFLGTELKLGDDGRIPPPLTLVGAKLQPTWMKKVLFDGESVRHYMATRMPQYGAANLEHLPPLLHRVDVVTGPAMNLPRPDNRDESERQQEKLLRAAGRELLGDKGLNCVACHKFNGKAAPGSTGIDLLTSYPRLQPAWFNRYLRNPGTFRPRTVMPTAWPNGIAMHKTILDGNTDRQIEAIWYYLSLGTSAADPPGIQVVPTKLTVKDRAVVHRGRSRVAGFRGIAVGFPEKLNYAFNAETGTLSAIWQGDFIGVNWSGQGSGDFSPAAEAIMLTQDVSFASLADETAPWPQRPTLTQEARTNPNPLYPRNVGYQFRGYFLDESSVPTFQYRSGPIDIDDRSVAVGAMDRPRLKRVLQFDSPKPQNIWFRVLAGEIHRETQDVYRSGRLRLKIPAVDAKLRSPTDDPLRSELLLPLSLPQGKSSLELIYEQLER